MHIKLGTRKSPLALAQASMVKAALKAAHAGLHVELVGVVTSGDRFLGQPLAEIGGKGLFTKELDDMQLAGAIDLAVHSMKDVPTVLPDGLMIGAMPKREDPRDVLLCAVANSVEALPMNATVGTSSLRRGAQLLALRPDLRIVPLRGNVQTRLAKLEAGEMQATLLAQAGLNRLGLAPAAAHVLPVEQCIPAVAQGAIGIQCRADDATIHALLAPLRHPDTETAVLCERAFLRELDGSCRTPIAGHAWIEGGVLHFRGWIAQPDGTQSRQITRSGRPADAFALGQACGQALKK